MAPQSTRVFSLGEANKAVPEVAAITEETVARLNRVREKYSMMQGDESKVPDPALHEIEELLQEWAQRIEEMGAFPKGYFTVDFQSVDPEMLYCWSYGEDKIGFTHKVWENFAHRRPLPSSPAEAEDHLKWVN